MKIRLWRVSGITGVWDAEEYEVANVVLADNVLEAHIV